MQILMLLLGLVLGGVLIFFILQPKMKSVKELDKRIEEENRQLGIANYHLQKDYNKQKKENDKISEQFIDLKRNVDILLVQETEIKNRIQQTKEQGEKNNEEIYQKSYELMQEKLSQAADKESVKFQEAQDEAREEYLEALQEIAAAVASKREEFKVVENDLRIMRAKADAAIQAAKREEEKILELDKYKVLVSDLDLLEINRLREIAPYFRNSRPIYKIIWESYYRNSTTDMINRVLGAGAHTGIYRLTNLTNQKIYIGQAVDIADRFKQHIKCGLGIDTPSNMLYKAMLRDGVENFIFEVIEECDRCQLNDRETYYIDFYRSQEHGYNMNRGGSKGHGKS